MNFNTLTTGSILLYEGEFIKLDDKSGESYSFKNKNGQKFCALRDIDNNYKHEGITYISISDLQPVPMTPELLRYLGMLGKEASKVMDFFNAKVIHYFTNARTDYIVITPPANSLSSIELTVVSKKGEFLLKGDIHIHDLQAAIKLAEIDFTITLEDLKDYKP